MRFQHDLQEPHQKNQRLNKISLPLTEILYHPIIILYKRQINLKAGNSVTFFISTLHLYLKSHALRFF